MAQRLEVTASEMNVYPDGFGNFKVDMRISRDEYDRVLGNYDLGEVIDHCGADYLLDAMDNDKIAQHLRECGYKVEEGEA